MVHEVIGREHYHACLVRASVVDSKIHYLNTLFYTRNCGMLLMHILSLESRAIDQCCRIFQNKMLEV